MPRNDHRAKGRQPRRALSTGQAARLCFVTPDSIVNWIKSGFLQAQRTAGGQYRIRVTDLRDFMVSRGMSTERLDQEHGVRVPCWELRGGCALGDASSTPCEDCIVQFLGALHCYRLMAMRPQAERHDCSECHYYRRWGETPTDLRWAVLPAPGGSEG